jgi:hypothetical protein
LLVLAFEGWAQCRLATDPDPSDEPRGVSGWTYAVAGEPDLDRILRLQPEDATARIPGPPIGVRVTSHQQDGRAATTSPLVGGRAMLLGDPVFDGRNGLAHEDTREPIVPFHLRIEGKGVALERRHADADGRPVITLPGSPTAPPERAATAIGVSTREDRMRFRQRRAEALRRALAEATSPLEKAALTRRLRAFEPGAPAITTAMLGVALPFRITIDGEDGTVADPSRALDHVDLRSSWQVQMSVGIWDADALCAWIDGTLSIPLLHPRS